MAVYSIFCFVSGMVRVFVWFEAASEGFVQDKSLVNIAEKHFVQLLLNTVCKGFSLFNFLASIIL